MKKTKKKSKVSGALPVSNGGTSKRPKPLPVSGPGMTGGQKVLPSMRRETFDMILAVLMFLIVLPLMLGLLGYFVHFFFKLFGLL